ncbi:MAG: ABC transporter ATP-binding protein [Desulfobacterales bacterium]|jgi:ATP-binding cassette, subfamily B, bacterial MsbA|nr:ABC transporter ATP-binding protein [Desulfobacteraceae bacterium]MBT4364410.1 ABC transporter ATP-binding protein [Desulfobacteraceae bacterium]MBT7085695.1 ABC transporter ATP-binding protein [Desulfobacterales bacterium]MBT7696230.1 ABC transporter ATP-binding protein [Desulfobacterales bacterium]
MKKENPKIFNSKVRRLLLLVKEHRFRLYFAMFCMAIVSASQVALAYLIKPAIDDVFVSKNVEALTQIPFYIIIVCMIAGIGMYGQEYFMSYVGESIIKRLRDDLYEKITDFPLAFFHEKKTGVLMARITNDVNIIKAAVSTAVTVSIKDLFLLIGLAGLIIYQIWQLAIAAFVVLPLAFFPIVLLGRKARKISTGTQESMADLNVALHETFTGNKIVKAFGMEEYEKNRFYKKTHRLFSLEVKAVIVKSLSSPIMETLTGIGIAFIIWYGGSDVIEGKYTVGTFISFIAAVMWFYGPAKKLSGLNVVIQQGFAAADRVYEIIDSSSDIMEIEEPIEIIRGAHSVTFRGVDFKYDKELVLKDINLKANPGEVIALVGTSGGGKTSFVNLIPRFYDVCGGAVLINEIDIRNSSLSSVRDQIAIVTQEPILFNESVKDNIAYGNQNATDEEIENAAKAAFAFDFIQNFPDKFDTIIGELGARLSGGEKQRICIARALIKDAPILILDEATSALDTESEMLVQKALANLMNGRTTFIIAHRLSTIGHADRIVVIVKGRVVEEGKHDELIALKGEYYKLYNMQYENGEQAGQE